MRYKISAYFSSSFTLLFLSGIAGLFLGTFFSDTLLSLIIVLSVISLIIGISNFIITEKRREYYYSNNSVQILRKVVFRIMKYSVFVLLIYIVVDIIFDLENIISEAIVNGIRVTLFGSISLGIALVSYEIFFQEVDTSKDNNHELKSTKNTNDTLFPKTQKSDTGE